MSRFSGLKFLLVLSILCYLTRPVLSGCQDATFDEKLDYFPDKAVFSNDTEVSKIIVKYNNNYIIVTDNNDNNAIKTYVLYCTAKQPVVTENVTSYIQIPVKNVAVSDRSVISFLEILGEETTSLKYVDDKKAITSPCLQKHSDLYSNIDYSNTSQVASFDVIFTNGPTTTGGNYVTISYDDKTPALKKAEWIKFISLFFNKTAIANDAFDKIKNNYLCHLNNLSQVPNQTKKTIAWVAHENDNTFTIEYNLFYSNITLDAAAFILNPLNLTGLTANELQEDIFDSYIVIDMSNFGANDSTLDTWKRYFGYNQTSNLPRFLNEKRLFRTHKLLNSDGYDDWSESSPSRPDLLLQDLIAMQYPLYQKDYIVRWFNNFAETGGYNFITAGQCNDSTFGLPKTDFGTCAPTTFLGDGKGNNGTNVGTKDGNNSNGQKKPDIIIIAVSLIGSLLLLGLGAWLLVVARRKYRERFVRLTDEPVVQMDSVREVR